MMEELPYLPVLTACHLPGNVASLLSDDPGHIS